MVYLLLIIQNEKEGHVLKQAFEQYDIKVVLAKPTFANYIQSIQVRPNCIMMEIPRVFKSEQNFMNLLIHIALK